MGGGTIAQSITRIEALDIQSSTYGATVALVYGQNRVPGNLIWYGGFNSQPVEGSSGKGGSQPPAAYNYTSDVMMAICEGPIAGINITWVGNSMYQAGSSGNKLANESFSIPAGGFVVTVSHANVTVDAGVYIINAQDQETQLVYPADYTYNGSSGQYIFSATGNAANGGGIIINYEWYSSSSYGVPLTNSTETYTTTGNFSYTVTEAANFVIPLGVLFLEGQDSFLLTDGVDYTRTGGTYQFNASSIQVGAQVAITYQWNSIQIFNDGLGYLGLSLYPGYVGQPVWTRLTTNYANNAIGYSGYAYVAAVQYNLGQTASIQNHSFEVNGFMSFSISGNLPDCNPKDCLFDALTNARYGAAMPSSMFGDLTNWGNYCLAAGLLVSPAITTQSTGADIVDTMAKLTNSQPVWSGGKLTMVPYGDANLSGAGPTIGMGFTWNANNAAVYDLNDDDFISTDSPIDVTRSQQSDASNWVQVEYIDRGNNYNVAIAESKDQASIDQYGLRSASSVSAHWICRGDVAGTVAQHALQRSVYVRNQYKFSLPWTFCMLDPMDIVTLNDPALGFNKLPVRIIQIDEAEDGQLDITAEDFTLGAASAIEYPRQAPSGWANNYNASAGNSIAPVIFEMPGSLTTTGLELGIAVAGDTLNWGGCQVWASYDGESYVSIGTITGSSRYGTLVQPFANGSANVQIYEGQLTGATGNSSVLGTLCYVGTGNSQEFFAYTNATLQNDGSYVLSGLARGAYETPIVAHNAGDPFVRVDSSIAVSAALDKSLIGTTVYIKLCSFNLYGTAMQSLADVEPFPYVVTGIFINSKPGIETYQQDTMPSAQNIGDLWQQTSTGDTFRWDGTEWTLYATVGANGSNFTGVVGIANMLNFSSFRDSTANLNTADGWIPQDPNGGIEPITPAWFPSGGMFGGGEMTVTWSVPNNTPKGIHTDPQIGGIVGGWAPGFNYVVSGYVAASNTIVDQSLEFNWVQAPVAVDWFANPILTTNFQRFAARIEWGSAVESNGGLGVFINGINSTGTLTFSAMQVTLGDVITEFVESSSDIRRAAVEAQVAASGACTAAAEALATLGIAASANVIVPSEKRAFSIDYNTAVTNNPGIVAQAFDFNVSATTYNSAYSNLISYMATLDVPTWWYDPSGSTNINGAYFLAVWTNYYTQEQYLLNGISAAAQALANLAQTSANSAIITANAANNLAISANTVAYAAQANALAAEANAAAALANLGVSVSQTVLTPAEKRSVIIDYNGIIIEQSGVLAIAANYGISTNYGASYNSAINNLSNLLTSYSTPVAWNNLAGSTTIVGATLVSDFTAVYSAKQNLLNEVATLSGALATAANSTAALAYTYASNASAAAASAAANAATAFATGNEALNGVFAIANQNMITDASRPMIVQDYNVIYGEYPNIIAQAEAFGIVGSNQIAAYENAYSNLNFYLNVTVGGGWYEYGINIPINGAVFINVFQTYYIAKEALLLEVAAVAGTIATWNGVSNVAVTPGQINVNLEGPSLNQDPSFTDSTAWVLGPGASFITVTDGVAGTSACELYWGGGASDSYIHSRNLALTPLKQYSLSVIARMVNGTGQMWMRLVCLDINNNILAEALTNANMEGVILTSGWALYSGSITPPAGTVSAYMDIESDYNTSGINQFQDFRLVEMVPTQSVAPGAATDVVTATLTNHTFNATLTTVHNGNGAIEAPLQASYINNTNANIQLEISVQGSKTLTLANVTCPCGSVSGAIYYVNGSFYGLDGGNSKESQTYMGTWNAIAYEQFTDTYLDTVSVAPGWNFTVVLQHLVQSYPALTSNFAFSLVTNSETIRLTAVKK